jgi:hypothetical protein
MAIAGARAPTAPPQQECCCGFHIGKSGDNKRTTFQPAKRHVQMAPVRIDDGGTWKMTRESTDAMEWRKRNPFALFELDVGTMFRAGGLFTARGFSHSTIRALVVAGIEAPERLLFADDADLRSIPGLDEEALGEIARYRAQFVGSQRQHTWRAFNARVPSGAHVGVESWVG